jgi:hypothetical protein
MRTTVLNGLPSRPLNKFVFREKTFMVEALIQAATLVLHGGRFLSEGPESNLSEGFSQLSAFRICQQFQFERVTTRTGAVIATLPSQWLKRLKKEEVGTFRLDGSNLDPGTIHTPPTGNGKGWNILCEGEAGIELWSSEWKYRSGTGANWKVCYASSRGNRLMLQPVAPVSGTGPEFLASMSRLADFIERAGDKLWAKRLRALLMMHEQGILQLERWPDLFPPGTPQESRLYMADIVRTYMVLTSNEFRQWLPTSDELAPRFKEELSSVWKKLGQAAESVVNQKADADAVLPAA